MSTTLTREYLLTRLDYDRATGFFTWRETKGWRAFIGHNGKVKALGYFLTPELASAAYQEARKKYFEINS
jgi:hypothetical protein